MCFIFGVVPGKVVLLASNSQGFVGEQRVQSLTLLSGNLENEGENSQRNVCHLDFSYGIRERAFNPLDLCRTERTLSWTTEVLPSAFHSFWCLFVICSSFAIAHP